MKYVLLFGILLIAATARAQVCNCDKEFLYIRNIVENNFAGFDDRVKTLTKEAYTKKSEELLALSRNKYSSDNCILVINKYLDLFKSHHLGLSSNVDPFKTDTDFVNHRALFDIKDDKLKQLKRSGSWEGIYVFIHDSSYKIAVVKDESPLHDYLGVILESSLPTWKRGMIKFEGKLKNDTLLEGLLYMRNHRPKFENFGLYDNNNKIGGDWLREGTVKDVPVASPATPVPENIPLVIDAKKLSPNTYYFKIGSFAPGNKPAIDSILRADEHILNSTPNMILDLRDNGGGSDDLWEPLIPYFYTQPIKMTGTDVRATDTTISILKKYLKSGRIPKENVRDLTLQINRMEQAKGRWVKKNNDSVYSYLQPKLFPRKIVILIDRWCGSSTEELLLAARQSAKVVLAGENTIGNLDYSNIVEIPFSCYPYTLIYPTTRSRRLDIGQGIDNAGIAPKYHLDPKTDWIKEALKIVEQ